MVATVALAIFAWRQIKIYQRQTRVMDLTFKTSARAARAASKSAEAAEKAVAKSDEILIHARVSSAEANKISREAIVAANRPWLSVELAIQHPLRVDHAQQIAVTHAFIVIKNIGKAPARSVRISWMGCFVNNQGPKQVEAITSLVAPSPGAALFPDQDLRMGAMGCIFRFSELGESERHPDGAGGFVFLPVIVGAIRYESDFSTTPHFTEFAFQLSRIEPPNAFGMAFLSSTDEVPPNLIIVQRAFAGNELAT